MIAFWVAALVWMLVIYSLSSQPAEQSNGLSKGMTKIIIDVVDHVHQLVVETNTKENWLDELNNTVREYAHAMVYFALAVFVFIAVRRSKIKGIKALILSFAFCALYASTDEFHQKFVPGRGAEVKDFLVDCMGAILGLMVCSIAAKLLGNRVKRWNG